MKYILFSAVLIFLSFNAHSQSFEETLKFIQTNINEFQYKNPASLLSHSHEITVSQYGEMSVHRIINNELKSKTKVYLQNVDTSVVETIDRNMYRLWLGSTSLKPFTILSIDDGNNIETNDSIAFLMGSLIDSNKLANAFKHLIKLAKENPNFREKDIF
ncbi:hypothetical protein KO02_12210 [Sphingobacterium sp. ML3W]|uniref:hypothetical protein n=1 Tax=Sphingobacterium sp. ML3W TaxID=1538644 RepID=UPI0004F5F75E|nr:hypothetical protein [Sphingobacterium sp. ML3W]AIM37369.1 hypothetical protein KO02_12210 [Sphingobacterium sp. ML3W]